MCGIAGIFDTRAAQPVPRRPLDAMLAALDHRGPDARGVHMDGALALGATRLQIIDRENGHQPLSNADGSVWVAFNGEIYNHMDLRRRLEARGHRFSTRCDTEAIVHAWDEWG